MLVKRDEIDLALPAVVRQRGSTRHMPMVSCVPRQRVRGEALDQRHADAVDQVRQVIRRDRDRRASRLGPSDFGRPNKITVSVHLQQLQMHLSCRSKSRAQHGNAAATPGNRGRGPWNSATSRSATITTTTIRATPNQFVADITAEALYADQLGMHSAWIGEHHFNSLGVLSCPDLVLAYIAARTKHIRLAPAVTVLPLHHPIRVAEQWATLDLLSDGRVDFAAGRGYDRREYAPFHVVVRRQPGRSSRRAWSWCASCGRRTDRISHHGKHYSVRRRAHHAEAGAAADPDLCRRRSPSPRSSLPRGSAAG